MAQKTLEQRKQEALDRQSILAPRNVTAPSSQQMTRTQSQDAATDSRLNQPAEQLTSGATRSISQDLSNLQQLQKIQAAQDALSTTTSVAGNALTPEEQILLNASGSSAQSADDLSRALHRLQKSCNHRYSDITGRCTICDKQRTSHLHD